MSDWETVPSLPSAPTKSNNRVGDFVATYGPVAEQVGQKIGVSPDILLAKFGLETGWGKSVIPGTNNLGNIKDFSGKGAWATDNWSGSRDAYLRFNNPEQFGEHYAGLIQRLYPGAIGTGNDPMAFGKGLMTGKRGAYAEDPNYVTKIAQALPMVTNARAASGGWEDIPSAPSQAQGSDWEDVPASAPKQTAEAPKAPASPTPAAPAAPKRTMTEELQRQLGLTARYGLQGAERALTFPVRAIAEAVGTGAEMLGAKDAGGYIRRNLGMGGNAGRVVADAANLPKPEGTLEKVVGGASETIAGLGVGGAAQKIAENAPTIAQNTVKAILPTATTGKEAAAYSAIGGAMDVAPVETAAALAVATAGKAGYDKMKVNKAVEGIIKNAGNNAVARTDAEVIKRVGEVADDPARFFKGKAPETLSAQSLNQAVTKSFLDPVKKALDDLPKNAKPENLKDLKGALQNWRGLSEAQREALRGTPYGDAVADAIFKATRSSTLTSAVPAKGGIVGNLVRETLDRAPATIASATTLGIPIPVKLSTTLGIGQRLMGRQSREQVASQLLNPRNREAADIVLGRLGPSNASESLSNIQQLAQRAQATAQARQAQEAAARTASLAERAQARNQVLQQTRVPQGGSFQELLTGGRSGLNMTTDQAIDALRTVSRMDKTSPVSQAAQSILRSENVRDPNAFYGVQNMIRRLSEEGKVAAGVPNMGTASSGIRNPVSYAANVRTAEEAAKLARESAPNKALSQFANKVAGTKNPADKLALIEGRLEKATDPAEIDYLNNIVRPLANFGKK